MGNAPQDVASSTSANPNNEMYDVKTNTYRQFPVRRKFHEGKMSQDKCEVNPSGADAGAFANLKKGDVVYLDEEMTKREVRDR